MYVIFLSLFRVRASDGFDLSVSLPAIRVSILISDQHLFTKA